MTEFAERYLEDHARPKKKPLACRSAADESMAPYKAAVARGKVLEALRAEAIERFANLFPGLLASYTHLLGYDISELPTVLERLGRDVLRYTSKNPRAMTAKFERAEERYALLR